MTRLLFDTSNARHLVHENINVFLRGYFVLPLNSNIVHQMVFRVHRNIRTRERQDEQMAEMKTFCIIHPLHESISVMVSKSFLLLRIMAVSMLDFGRPSRHPAMTVLSTSWCRHQQFAQGHCQFLSSTYKWTHVLLHAYNPSRRVFFEFNSKNIISTAIFLMQVPGQKRQ